jgi:hypothetical protein
MNYCKPARSFDLGSVEFCMLSSLRTVRSMSMSASGSSCNAC